MFSTLHRLIQAAPAPAAGRPRWKPGLRLFAASAVALASMIALAACTSDGSEPSEPAGVSPSLRAPTAPAGDPVEEAKQAVLVAYRGMWEAYDQVGSAPEAGPGDPALTAHAAGAALQMLVDGVTALRDQGLVTAGEVALSPVVVELSPEGSPIRAQIEDCADTSASSRVRADGESFEDEPGGRRSVVATMEVASDGIWRVIDFAVRSVGSC